MAAWLFFLVYLKNIRVKSIYYLNDYVFDNVQDNLQVTAPRKETRFHIKRRFFQYRSGSTHACQIKYVASRTYCTPDMSWSIYQAFILRFIWCNQLYIIDIIWYIVSIRLLSVIVHSWNWLDKVSNKTLMHGTYLKLDEMMWRNNCKITCSFHALFRIIFSTSNTSIF